MTIRLSILYLDDDPAQLEVFRELFGSDHDVRATADLQAALRSLAECAADVIISDQSIPGLGGADFLRTAARICPDSVRVLLTGAFSVGEATPHVTAGAVHMFISKPWTVDGMRRALERAGAILDLRARRGASTRRPGKGGQ